MLNTTTPETPQADSLLLRILAFPPVLLAIMYYGLSYSYLAGFFHRTVFAKAPGAALLSGVMCAATMIAVYAVMVIFIERRRATELEIGPGAKELPLGLILGFGLYTACILVLMAMGIFQINGSNAAVLLVVTFAGPLCTGVFEELFFRGGVFRIAEQYIGTWTALVLSSLVFGFIHADNEAATMQGLISISLWAGLLLSACYILTRRMWLGIGVHAAWNYTQGGVYSGIISGNGESVGYFKSSINGPELLTGGAFGVEASVVAFVICSAVGVAMMVMAVKRGQIVAPRWSLPKS